MLRMICVAALLGSAIACAQSAPAPVATANPRLDDKAAPAKQITFEVASIRRNKAGAMGGTGPTDDGYSVRNYSPQLLIGMAYAVSEFQRIEGLPDWAKWGAEGYDITAKVSDADIAEWKRNRDKQFPGAIRALLADRFGLQAHFETRDSASYALMVAKGGSKLKAATPDEAYPGGFHDRAGKPVLGLGQKADPATGHQLLIAQAASIAQLAQLLSSLMNETLGRQVVDKTGLVGAFDFQMPVYLAQWRNAAQADDGTPSIFTVMQDSLGLRLEPTKTPVQYLVIDHIERPTEN